MCRVWYFKLGYRLEASIYHGPQNMSIWWSLGSQCQDIGFGNIVSSVGDRKFGKELLAELLTSALEVLLRLERGQI